MRRPGLLRATVAAISFVVALSLTACGSNAGDEMTPKESREAFLTLVKDTATVVAPDGWAEIGPPGWSSCSADGAEGASTDWAYGREPLTDHAANAQKVADYWESLGMQVRIVSEPNYSVYATGGATDAIAFHTAPGLYGISGSARCVPGDAKSLIDEQLEQQ